MRQNNDVGAFPTVWKAPTCECDFWFLNSTFHFSRQKQGRIWFAELRYKSWLRHFLNVEFDSKTSLPYHLHKVAFARARCGTSGLFAIPFDFWEVKLAKLNTALHFLSITEVILTLPQNLNHSFAVWMNLMTGNGQIELFKVTRYRVRLPQGHMPRRFYCGPLEFSG